MLKKLIIVIFVLSTYSVRSQDISIFFLKDGSIIQGNIVNENQHRIFLKTEQGTIKILHGDILGREDAARKGDLAFVSDRLEYLQGNVNHLSGQVNHWNDSLKTALDDIHELYKNLEVLQNEFEIDLLRLHSQGREQKKKIEYVQDDLVTQRVEIASNRQGVGGLDDTVSTLNQQFYKVKQKLDITANQSYLLSGNLSSIKKDIQTILNVQENQQNQIDMMAGALANNIQEVIRVQGKFGDVELGVQKNELSLKNLSNDLNDKTDDINRSIKTMLNELTARLDEITSTITKMDENTNKSRRKINKDIGDLSNELTIISDKVNTISRDLRSTDEKVKSVVDKIDIMDSDVKKIEIKITKLKSQVESIPINEE